MADQHYDTTGLLVLDEVTPIITALFGNFRLQPFYPEYRQAYFARLSGTTDPQWSDVHNNLIALAAKLALPLPDDGSVGMGTVLKALSKHFGAEHDKELDDLINGYRFEGSADLEALFLIATRINDGHNLAEMQYEGAWYCNTPRLFGFGGHGCFLSREVQLSSNSQQAADIGRHLRQKLLENDLDAAAGVLAKGILRLFSAVTDQRTRLQLRQRVSSLLQIGNAGPAS